MNKKGFGLALVFSLMLVFIVSASWALDNGPETIDINAQANYAGLITKRDKKQVPGFPHKMHQEEFLEGNAQYSSFEYTDDYTCAGCHHTNKAGEQPEGCLKCKDVNDMLDAVGGAKKFEKIYHKNCRDACHKAMSKAGKQSGPTKCKGCHG
jgi:cytochrome c553